MSWLLPPAACAALCWLSYRRLVQRADVVRRELLDQSSPAFFASSADKDLPRGVQLTHIAFMLLPVRAQHFFRDHVHALQADVVVALMGVLLLGPRLLWATLTGAGCTTHSYGDLPEQCLDVFVPRQTTPSSARGAPPRPVLVFVHGGAWGSGRKLFYRPLCAALATQCDAVVVSVGYRVWSRGSARAHCSMQCDDVRLATQWASLNASALGGDAARIYLCGHSSGAHICALSALASPIAESQSRVAGLIALAAPMSPPDHFEFERARGVHELSPMGAACAPLAQSCCVQLAEAHPDRAQRIPRYLLIHGAADSVVPCASTLRFAKALCAARQVGGDHGRLGREDNAGVKTVIVPAMDHAGPILDFIVGGESARCASLIREFLHGMTQ